MKINPTIQKFIIIALVSSIVVAIAWLLFKKIKPASNYLTGKGKEKGGKNNPGHLRYTNAKWKGKIYPPEGTTYEFESFETLGAGIRAWLINANTQLNKGYNTIDKFVDRLTPASENPEAARKAMKNEIRKKLGKETIETTDLWKIAPIIFKYEGNKDWEENGKEQLVYTIAYNENMV